MTDGRDVKLEGVRAFQRGEPDSVCPYNGRGSKEGMSQRRVWWMTGYWAAHVVQHVRVAKLEEQLA